MSEKTVRCRICSLPPIILREIEENRQNGMTLQAIVDDFNSKLSLRKETGYLSETEKDINVSTLHYHFSKHTDNDTFSEVDKIERDTRIIMEALQSRIKLFRELVNKYDEVIAIFDSKMKEWKNFLEIEKDLREEYLSWTLPRYKQEMETLKADIIAGNITWAKAVEDKKVPYLAYLPTLPGLPQEEDRILSYLEKARKQLADAIKTMSPEETYMLYIKGELNVFLKQFVENLISEHKKLEEKMQSVTSVEYHEQIREMLKDTTLVLINDFSVRWGKKKRELARFYNELS